MDEFELIRRFFSRDGASRDVVVGVGDDGALLRPTPGHDQVHVIDTLVEGVHFPANIGAADIGFRVVAVNLSDMAAMGAMPRWMTLALTLWDKDEEWVARFADGLYSAAAAYDVALVGGDTTQGDAVVATVHMTGEVEEGGALLRSGARVGDAVYVTGTVGDAAAGLALLQADVADDELAQRFLRPDARVAEGRTLRGRASAAIDISDGLVADLGKLAAASCVGAEIDIDRLPLSAAMLGRYDRGSAEQFALTGGDDYELCFTAPAGVVADLDGITEIGVITDGDRVVCRRDGHVADIDTSGYRHFS